MGAERREERRTKEEEPGEEVFRPAEVDKRQVLQMMMALKMSNMEETSFLPGLFSLAVVVPATFLCQRKAVGPDGGSTGDSGLGSDHT